jgi:hypothetical protein
MITSIVDALQVMFPNYIASMLSLLTYQWYLSAVVPIAICFVLVHVFFRHIIAVLWFSLKIALAVGMYLQFKEVIDHSIGPDPFGIDAGVLGCTIGTLAFQSNVMKKILHGNSLLLLARVCPMCVSPDTPHSPDETTQDTLFEKTDDSSWIAWARDM